MNLQEAIEVRKRVLIANRNEALKAEREADRARSYVYKQKESAIAELKRKLNEISKPFDKRIAELGAVSEKNHEIANKLEWGERHIELEVSGEFAVKAGKFESDDSFAGYLMKNNIRWSDLKMIGKRLPNGVTLFAKVDSTYSVYFAVYGLKIIGFHHTKKSEHPGDQADYSAWVGVSVLKIGNKLQAKQLNKWGSPYTDNLRFRQWKDEVSKIDASKATAIDITKKGNQHMLSCEYSMHFENEAVEGS
jgi:hypothetical protein